MYTFITGATGVLGKTFCEMCRDRGEDLYLTGRSEEKLERLRDGLSARGSGDIRVFPCDLTDEGERRAMFEDAGGLVFSRVINCAGADIQKGFSEYTQEKLAFQTRVNLEAAEAVCLFALGHRAERLSVLNVSSVSGIYPMPYFAVYSATKGALTSFSLALSEETRGSGVTVTAVLPGAVYTRADVIENIKTQGLWGRIAAKSPEYVARKALEAADRGKRTIIPGLANKLMNASTRLVPRGLRLRYVRRRWSRTRKDAFPLPGDKDEQSR